MTWHYIAGELSLLLEELGKVTEDEIIAQQICNLRIEAETVPFSALPDIAAESLALANDLCQFSLVNGDSLVFTRQLTVCSEIWRFGTSAGLLVDD